MVNPAIGRPAVLAYLRRIHLCAKRRNEDAHDVGHLGCCIHRAPLCNERTPGKPITRWTGRKQAAWGAQLGVVARRGGFLEQGSPLTKVPGCRQDHY